MAGRGENPDEGSHAPARTTSWATARSWRRASVAALAMAAVIAPAGALAGSDSRQTAEATFTTKRPGQSTGLRLSIDYRNPEDPSVKPPAVAKVITKLARGARLDTSVPKRCQVSDAELIAQGPGACPPGSRVGDGTISLDTGASGPLRVVENDVTFFNDDDELIFLTESTNTPSVVRAVVRAPVERRRFTAEVPPIPGVPPPDPFAAIKGVRVALDAVESGRRSYITTPSSCPSRGRWLNSVGFTYRDGVTQTRRSASPCRSDARTSRRTEFRRR